MDDVTGREGFKNSLGDDFVISVGSAHSEALNIPGGDVYLSADFIRTGYDLTLKVDGAQTIVIPDYFMSDTAPDLLLDTGAVVSGALAAKLAGPMTVGQYAQLQDSPGGVGEPIGSVTELDGAVLVTRVDGTQVTLGAGDSVFQGDVIETGAKSSIGVVFADDTTFSLDAGGRMVLDEMVYDPDAQTGVFEATVVKGVFSFVSGQVAKVGPDSMVLHTPKTTIGIRGSTGLVKSGVNGGEDLITLVPDIDGNLGELIVSNQGGFMVLNQPNASTTVFSAFQPPSPVVFMSPQEVQQNFGGALTVLVRTEAKKAVVKAEQAAQKADEADQQAAQQQEEAAAAEEEAAQADEAAAQAEAAAAQAEAEAEAAAAEAEAAADPEAKAAAEAKLAEAEAKLAAAEAKAATQSEAAAAKAAEAAAKATDAADAAQQAAEAAAAQQQAQQFSQMAGQAANTQQQMFTQFVSDGPVNPGPMGPADAKGMIYISPTGEAITVGGDGEVIVIGADGTAKTGTLADLVDTIVEDAIDQAEELYGDQGSEAILPNVSVVNTGNNNDDDEVILEFAEVIQATSGGGTLSGSSLNTNFYFPFANFLGSYTVSDAGGTDQLAFDSLDTVHAYLEMDAQSAGSGSVVAYNAISGGTQVASIGFSGIEQMLVSDGSVSSFGTVSYQTTGDRDVLIFPAFSAGQTGYVIAGSSAADTITLNHTANGMIVFGKGGGDTFNVQTTSALIAIGGVTSTDNVDSNSDYVPDQHVNKFDYSGWASAPGLTVNVSSSDDTTVVQKSGTAFAHELWDVGHFVGGVGADTITVSDGNFNTVDGWYGNDIINVSSGAKVGTLIGNTGDDTFVISGTVVTLQGTSGVNSITLNSGATVTTLTGGAGNDTITVNSSATATTVSGGLGTNSLTVLQGGSIGGYTGGAGDDTVVMDSALLANAITIDGAGHATNDNLTIKAYAGASVNLNTKTATLTNFESTTVTGVDSTSGVTLVGYSGTATTLDGSGYSDTLTGGSGNDTIQGQHSADTLTGGTGSDTFVYYSTSDAGDTLQDFNGATNFAGSAGESDKLAFSTSGLGLSSIVYEEIAWNGSSTALTLTNAAANVVVLTGGTAGTYTNALTALASGNAAATNAVFIFNDSGNSSSGTGTVAYTTDMAGGAGTNVSLATFNGVTSDMVHLAAGDFAVV